MPGFLFRSRWVAALWVLGVLIAVAAFSGNGVDALQKAAANIRAKHAHQENPAEEAPVAIATPSPEPEVPVGDEPRAAETQAAEISPGTARQETRRQDSAQDGKFDSYVVVDPAATTEHATTKDIEGIP